MCRTHGRRLRLKRVSGALLSGIALLSAGFWLEDPQTLSSQIHPMFKLGLATDEDEVTAEEPSIGAANAIFQLCMMRLYLPWKQVAVPLGTLALYSFLMAPAEAVSGPGPYSSLSYCLKFFSACVCLMQENYLLYLRAGLGVLYCFCFVLS